MGTIFKKKFEMTLSVHCPPPPQTFVYIWGRSETQTVKLEAHSAQITHN